MSKLASIVIIVAIGVLSFKAYQYPGCKRVPLPHQQGLVEENELNTIAPLDHLDNEQNKTRTFSSAKVGCTFQYPSSWMINGEEAEVIDRSGALIAVVISFIDTANQSTLSLEYHMAPQGKELYKYAHSQFDASQGWYAKGGSIIEVAGNEAVKASASIEKDGKGNTLNPPLRIVMVDFLDQAKSGAFQLQFKTPSPNEQVEIVKFEHLLSSFQFLE